MASNVVVLDGFDVRSLGDFFRKLAMQADLGVYTLASVALVTPESDQHNCWWTPAPYNNRDTNDLAASTATMHYQLLRDNVA